MSCRGPRCGNRLRRRSRRLAGSHSPRTGDDSAAGFGAGRLVGQAAIVTVLLILMASAGCGRKGDPLPPLREPDPVTETAPGEAVPAEDETAAPEEDEEAAADGDEGAGEEPDGEDDKATPP